MDEFSINLVIAPEFWKPFCLRFCRHHNKVLAPKFKNSKFKNEKSGYAFVWRNSSIRRWQWSKKAKFKFKEKKNQMLQKMSMIHLSAKHVNDTPKTPTNFIPRTLKNFTKDVRCYKRCQWEVIFAIWQLNTKLEHFSEWLRESIGTKAGTTWLLLEMLILCRSKVEGNHVKKSTHEILLDLLALMIMLQEDVTMIHPSAKHINDTPKTPKN